MHGKGKQLALTSDSLQEVVLNMALKSDSLQEVLLNVSFVIHIITFVFHPVQTGKSLENFEQNSKMMYILQRISLASEWKIDSGKLWQAQRCSQISDVPPTFVSL